MNETKNMPTLIDRLTSHEVSTHQLLQGMKVLGETLAGISEPDLLKKLGNDLHALNRELLKRSQYLPVPVYEA